MAFRKIIVAALALVLVLAIAGCGSSAPPAESGQPATGGQALVEQKCTMCHPIDQVNAAKYDKAKWEATVSRMETNGLVVTAEEKQAIIDYLAERDAAR